MRIISSLALTALLFTSATADAQRYMPNLDERLSNLEASVRNLKSGSGATASPAGLAQIQTDIARMEEELRRLRGATEENRHAITQLRMEMKRTSEDYEFRFNELEGNSLSTGTPEAVEAPAVAPAVKAAPAAKELPFTKPAQSPEQSEDPVGDIIENSDSDDAYVSPAAPEENDTSPQVNNFTNAREHYNYAVSLVRDKRYDRARDSLQSFLKQHGEDRLAGNAHYWLGETYYVRSDFPSAADEFRRGFEVQPEGIKAPDNLYKLSKSLINMGKTDQACVVLAQIQKRYKSRNPEVAGLAFETEKNAGCDN